MLTNQVRNWEALALIITYIHCYVHTNTALLQLDLEVMIMSYQTVLIICISNHILFLMHCTCQICFLLLGEEAVALPRLETLYGVFQRCSRVRL